MKKGEMTMPNRGKEKRYQGMNWISPKKRLALYLRDGLACCWCGASVELGFRLTLDHLTPHSQGGSNHESNLVTACLACNSARGARPVELFAIQVAGYLDHGVTTRQILDHIATTTARTLDTAQARELIERRGGFSHALNALREQGLAA